MIAAQAIERPYGVAEPPPPPWVAPFDGRAGATGGVALAALAGTPFSSRFCSWTGLSGQRYVFSVYPAAVCPAFCDAVLLVVERDDAGRRRIICARNTGGFAEPVVARAEGEFRALGAGLEFHLHILASSPAEREAALADLQTLPT
jgi:hypothetical protein